jgi:hypothetical protein
LNGGVEVRLYRPGDEAGIVATFNLVFREVCGPSFADRSLDFWRWEFADRGLGRAIAVAQADDGRIIAHWGCVPLAMTTELGDMVFLHSVDSFVHPDFRAGLKRPGVFVETGLLCMEHSKKVRRDALIYGYPVPAAERVGTRYLGYRLVAVVDYLCREVDGPAAAAPAGVRVERTRAVPDGIEELFGRAAKDLRCLVRRDAAYLRWRYLEVPGVEYEILAARRDGALAGFMVLRVAHELVPGCTCIADWIVPPDDVATTDALLAAAAERARAAGRRTLMAVFPPWSRESAALVARGFAVVPSSRWLERRLMENIGDPRVTNEWLRASWWYTLGDSDLV